MGNYDDIIGLDHHVSRVHPQMSRADRAAQFSPFAALTGYGEAIRETGRLTEERVELDEDVKERLDEKLRMLQHRIEERGQKRMPSYEGGYDYPEASITYFRPDDRKEGGSYVTVAGRVKKIDAYGQMVVMADGMRIPVGDIVGVEEVQTDSAKHLLDI